MVNSPPGITQDPLSLRLQSSVPRPYLYSYPRQPLPPQSSKHTQQPPQSTPPRSSWVSVPPAVVQHMQNPEGHRVDIRRKLLWKVKEERERGEGWEYVSGKRNGVIPSERYKWERKGGMVAVRGHVNVSCRIDFTGASRPSKSQLSFSQSFSTTTPPPTTSPPTRRPEGTPSPFTTPGAIAGPTYLAFPPGTSIHIHQHVYPSDPSQPPQTVSSPPTGRFVPLPNEVGVLAQGDHLWDRSFDTRHPSNSSAGSRHEARTPSCPATPTPVEDLPRRRSSLEHHRDVFGNAEDDAPCHERFADENPQERWPGGRRAREEALEMMRSLRPDPDVPVSVTNESESSGVYVMVPGSGGRNKLSPWSLMTPRRGEVTPSPGEQAGVDREETMQETVTGDDDGKSKSEPLREVCIRRVERLVNELYPGESVMHASVNDIHSVRLEQIYLHPNHAYIPLGNILSRPRVPSRQPFWKSVDRRKRQEEALEQCAIEERWAERRRELAEQAVEVMERVYREYGQDVEVMDASPESRQPEPKSSPPTKHSGSSLRDTQPLDSIGSSSPPQLPLTLPNLSRRASDSSFCSFGTCSTLSLPPLPTPGSGIFVLERPQQQQEDVAFRPFVTLPPVNSLNEPWVWITHALEDSLLVKSGGQWPELGRKGREGMYWHRNVYDREGRKGALGLKWWWRARRERKRARKGTEENEGRMGSGEFRDPGRERRGR